MGSITHFVLKTFLLHFVLYAGNGNGEATKEMIAEENDTVLRLPSMNKHTNHHHLILDPSWLIFFNLNDLKMGSKMPIYFPIKDSIPPLLSRNQANSIPFSYNHLPYLLHFFSFSPDSPQAKAMENTLRECEIKPIKGETKICATCLESTHDFVHETFGLETRFELLQTRHIEKLSRTIELDNYTILSEPEEIRVPGLIACHTLPYPYRVFYCHSQKSENKLYRVLLGGDNEGRVEAIAVCHMDTSHWSPDHASFRVLGTEPGASPVCHFFREDVLVYVPIYLD